MPNEPRIDHNHPILAAILTVRRKAATSFTPEHMGQRGEDFDAGLLAAYQSVEAALSILPRDPQGLVEALRWYQDKVSKCNRLTDDTARNALARDLGQRAAKALAAWEAGK
jgi:hypothetical protein